MPDRHFRDLRTQCRYRRTLVKRRCQVRTGVQKIINRAGVRIGGILTDIIATNGRRILDGLRRGDDRKAIFDNQARHVRGKLEQLGDALTLTLSDSYRLLLVDLMEEFDSLFVRERRLNGRTRDGLALWIEQIRLPTTIAGIDEVSVRAIFAEIEPDPDAKRKLGCRFCALCSSTSLAVPFRWRCYWY